MVNKISPAALAKLKEEPGTKVFVRRRAPVDSTPLPPEIEKLPPPKTEVHNNSIDISDLVIALEKSAKLAKGPPSPPKPRIKSVHVENIERNGQSRIESADFIITYGTEG